MCRINKKIWELKLDNSFLYLISSQNYISDELWDCAEEELVFNRAEKICELKDIVEMLNVL